MPFNRFKCQELFRDTFTTSGEEPFARYRNGKDIKDVTFEESDAVRYRVVIDDDIGSYYYRCILSFAEGIDAISRRNLSWATVKLYYAVYYGMRCKLLCKDIVFLRAMRHLYYVDLNNTVGHKYIKLTASNDHAATHEVYLKYFARTDFMLSSSIESYDVYMWLSKVRDRINYQENIFHEPDVSELWCDILSRSRKIGLANLIEEFLAERQFCFLSDTASLAAPVNIIKSVAQFVKNEVGVILTDEQKQWINGIVGNNIKEEYLDFLLF